MLRRRENYLPGTVTVDDLTLDKSNGELQCQNRTIRLTGKALQMMTFFMENPRIVFSVQTLMDRIWGWEAEAEINVVWVNISTLRKKLQELGTVMEIRAHRGTGYSLEKKA
ncbi:MAG: winged helix-turn-helix domain-containing protein [Clostridia bacterium]|nr:winged helix-turn-helix domain-containing protein [Clostridia bacterium]